MTILPSATRQACAVWLKNRVHTCYDIDTSEIRADRTPIPQSDRDALKSSLLRLLASTPSRPISTQLAATLKDIIIRDFPEKWPNLFPEINKLLVSGDIREVVAGCQASLELIKAFEYVTIPPIDGNTKYCPGLVEKYSQSCYHSSCPPLPALPRSPYHLRLLEALKKSLCFCTTSSRRT